MNEAAFPFALMSGLLGMLLLLFGVLRVIRYRMLQRFAAVNSATILPPPRAWRDLLRDRQSLALDIRGLRVTAALSSHGKQMAKFSLHFQLPRMVTFRAVARSTEALVKPLWVAGLPPRATLAPSEFARLFDVYLDAPDWIPTLFAQPVQAALLAATTQPSSRTVEMRLEGNTLTLQHLMVPSDKYLQNFYVSALGVYAAVHEALGVPQERLPQSVAAPPEPTWTPRTRMSAPAVAMVCLVGALGLWNLGMLLVALRAPVLVRWIGPEWVPRVVVGPASDLVPATDLIVPLSAGWWTPCVISVLLIAFPIVALTMAARRLRRNRLAMASHGETP